MTTTHMDRDVKHAPSHRNGHSRHGAGHGHAHENHGYVRTATAPAHEAYVDWTHGVTEPFAPAEARPQPLNGAAAAAILAAGVGGALLGILVTVAEAYRPLAKLLTFSASVGPLSGKTTVAMVGWLVTWAVIHWIWRTRNVCFRSVIVATGVLIGVALVGTFPPVYETIAALVAG
jgi:hypothetical protein